MVTVGNTAGMGGRREDCRDRVAVGEGDLGAGDDIGGDDLDGDLRVLEPVVGEVVADEAMQPSGSAQRGPGADEREELAGRRDREHVVSTQTAPHLREPVEGRRG